MNELAIQIHPMVPLAKACALLKISREELIQRLSSGELRGEKRRIGESKKDSWFIYADSFNRLLNQAVAQYEERVSTKGLDHIFNADKGAQTASAKVKGLSAVPPLMIADAPPPVVAEAAPQVTLEAAHETVQIDPVAFVHSAADAGEIVDALGTNYALGSDYDDLYQPVCDGTSASATSSAQDPSSDYSLSTTARHEVQIGQAMVAQLMQHLQTERQYSEALRDRLTVLEDEMEQLRREVLARPDQHSHSLFARVKNYFAMVFSK
jgi:hypothetical protein